MNLSVDEKLVTKGSQEPNLDVSRRSNGLVFTNSVFIATL